MNFYSVKNYTFTRITSKNGAGRILTAIAKKPGITRREITPRPGQLTSCWTGLRNAGLIVSDGGLIPTHACAFYCRRLPCERFGGKGRTPRYFITERGREILLKMQLRETPVK